MLVENIVLPMSSVCSISSGSVSQEQFGCVLGRLDVAMSGHLPKQASAHHKDAPDLARLWNAACDERATDANITAGITLPAALFLALSDR